MRLTEADRPGQQPQLRDFGIVVCDLRGFTAVTERYEALHVVDLLDHFFQTMVGVIHAHGGITDKFMGDSVLAFFDTLDSPDTPERMLACMLRMQLAMDDVNSWARMRQLPYLYMGIGATYGPATLCELGSPVYRELTVLGDTVNLAARITAFCLRGQILVSEPLFARIQGRVMPGTARDVHFKGKHNPVKIYEVLGQTLPCPLQLPVRDPRRHYRVDVDMDVSFQLIRGKELDDRTEPGRVDNISRNGLRMKTAHSLDFVTEIRMRLPFLPNAESSDVYARVMFSKEEEDGTCTVGVEFTYLDEETNTALNYFVDSLV